MNKNTAYWSRLRLQAFRRCEWAKRYLYCVLDNAYAPFIKEEDAIVVIGYHRSGTTFLLEALSTLVGRRQSFEPLSDSVPGARLFLHPRIYKNHLGVDKRVGFPYRRHDQVDSELQAFLKKALRGNLIYPRVWHRSRTLSNYKNKAMTVKLVWGNLLAAWLARTFGAKVIFLYRHPAGVIESILRQKWAKVFQDEAFLSLFLDQNELVDDWLLPFMEVIEKNQQDNVSRIALGYAIAHYVPFQQASLGEFSPLLVRYEDMVMYPDETFARIGSFIGKSFDSRQIEQLMSRPSSSTQMDRVHAASHERCFSWQNTLDKPTIDKIMTIIERFGLDHTLTHR